MAKKMDTIATVKEGDRLYPVWGNMRNRASSLGLPRYKAVSMTGKSFEPLAAEMTKTKKVGTFEREFDFESFAFEFRLMIGSSKTVLGSAQMNTVPMPDRKPVLDSLRSDGLISQSDVDKYMKEAASRAAKSSAVKKIDEAIEKAETEIVMWQKFIAGMAKTVAELDRGQRQMDLEPIAKKKGLGGYVRFVYGVDSGFNGYALMKSHFMKGADYPMPSFPQAIVEKLKKEFGADEKGEPDFTAARKIAGQVVDAKAMPAYRKEMSDASNVSIKKNNALLKTLREKRQQALGF